MWCKWRDAVPDNSTVVVYSGVRCADCEAVKNYLKERDVAFTEKNVHKNRASLQELTQLGFKSIPVTVIGEEVIAGFDREKLAAALSLG
jgi:glutaredoxin-like protein NrdH